MARSGQGILIDGNLGDAAWQTGPWHTDFTILNIPDKPAQVATRFKVLFDAQYLYVGIIADEPEPGAVQRRATQRDIKVWNDDCLEVMVGPTGASVEYYHFIVNPLGTIYDAHMRQGGHVSSAEWNSSVEVGVGTGLAQWSAEFRIPVVELGLSAASTGDWALNVTRARRVGGEELSTFAALTGGFHQPSLYATLTLEGADFSSYLWEIKSPYEVRVLPGPGGQLRYSAKTHVRNAGNAFRFFMLRGSLGQSTGTWVKDGLDAGQSREYEFSVANVTPGLQEFTLAIVDRRDPELRLARRQIQTRIAYTPVAIDMIQPWYRDSIYATQDIREIVFDVTLSLPEKSFAGRTLDVDLRKAEEGTAALAVDRQPAQATTRVRLPIPTLAVGQYTLTVRAASERVGQAAYAASTTIHKLPKVADEWRIDERNVLLHNGEPVLPFGWFSIPVKSMAEGGHAYELMQMYSAEWWSDEKAREYLDSVRAAKTHVTISPYPTNRMVNPPEVWGRPVTADEDAQLRGRVRALNHPGLFAWYMADEPELRPALPERCRRLYEICREEDPFRPCIMLNDTIAGIFKYVDGGDILMPDPYPCFIRGGLAARPIEKVGKFIKACQEAGGGRRAVWATPQAFNYGDVGNKNNRAPTLVEMRNELYQCVVYGAKGFLWYTHSHAHNYPHIRIGMPWLSYEVRDLKDAILENPATDLEVAVVAGRPEHIHVSPRRVGDDIYLFAVNTATEAQDVEFTVTSLAAGRSLALVSEGRRITPQGGKFRDRFDIYETHIYTTNTPLGERQSIESAKRSIATADAARRVAGNLAFEDNGVKIEFSSKARYGSTPERVVDGVTDGMNWRDGTAGKLPDWLTLRWPKPVTIKRVVVYSSSLGDYEIQIPDGEGWRAVGAVTGNAAGRIETILKEPVTTGALRLHITGLASGAPLAQIWEVEAYAK